MTCNFCGSKLEVVHDESVTHTLLLKDIAADLKVIQLQNDLEKLDREWAVRRETFMVAGKDATAQSRVGWDRPSWGWWPSCSG